MYCSKVQVDLRVVSSCEIINSFDNTSIRRTLSQLESRRSSVSTCTPRSGTNITAIMTNARIRRGSWSAGFLKTGSGPADSMALCCFTKMCGSLVYMAPEVFAGSVYNEKCDVFSMGMVFCELLSGRPMGNILKLKSYSDAFKSAEQACTPPLNSIT